MSDRMTKVSRYAMEISADFPKIKRHICVLAGEKIQPDRPVAAKVGNSSGFEASCPVKLKTCGFETTKTTPASQNFFSIDSSCRVK